MQFEIPKGSAGTSNPQSPIPNPPQFGIRVSGDNLGFSAAHFLALSDGQCEPLHGHNYRVAAELSAPLDEEQYVLDFAVVADALRGILGELDHAVLLPTQHPAISVRGEGEEVEARLGPRRWVFPQGDCRLLPLAATTVECLAEYIGRRLIDAIRSRGKRLDLVRIELEESPGRAAICELGP
jgi:6-pyruvoyltetrahydropterin/6-carboxytetrahydropterin synthase